MIFDARKSHLAVLIDADNVSHEIAAGLFAEIAKIGEVRVRRIYGDFRRENLKGWATILPHHAIMPCQNYVSKTGENAAKNASDIALVIDAMDFLHSGRFDGFCLVSSDSDFTRLAIRIREQGIDVFGFGAEKAPESFRKACHRFVCTEDPPPKGSVPEAKKVSARSTGPNRKPPTAAVPLIRKAIKETCGSDGWAPLSKVEDQLANLTPKFNPVVYGHSSLISLTNKTSVFELRKNNSEIRKKVENSAVSAMAKKPKAATG